jgi:hypothetical protein
MRILCVSYAYLMRILCVYRYELWKPVKNCKKSCKPLSAPEPEETCILGNNTIARGHRYEDGCSRTCICEAGGHLKCQPRCPPNDTTSGVNQHDRCVVLQDPRYLIIL